MNIFHILFAQSVTLQIPIGETKEVTVCSGGLCHGIALYIVEFAKWFIGAISMLAVIAIMFGGIIWLTSRANQNQVERAKKLIKDSLIGLGLALGAYLLLSVISPDLVDFEGVKGVEKIKKVEIEKKEAAMEAFLDKQSQSSGGTPLSGGGNIAGLRSQGKINTQCVGPGSCSGQKSGEWDKGLNGSGSNPVDARIRGAIELVAKTCGPITITGLNEKFGHSDGSKHYSGKAVDIGGTVCGASPNTCSDKQLQLVASLRKLGYGVGTPGGRCGGFKDGPGHFHIQVP